MSARNIQLVKWSFPAFAVIVGFFWYKRRRVERVDPGGVGESRVEAVDKKVELTDVKRGEEEQQRNLNLYDSGIHIDESFTVNGSSPSSSLSSEQQQIIRSPGRRVSESLDIPTRRSGSQPISIKSGKSSAESQDWYRDLDQVTDRKSIVLGSNPKSESFDSMARNKTSGAPIFEADRKKIDSGKVAQDIFENVTEEEEPTSNCVSKTQEYQENRPIETTVSQCNAIDVDNAKSIVETSANDPKNQGQVVSERDSANHSPVSGVLEGSLTDEVRSEGSTDSGKGGSIKGHAKKKSPTIYEFAIPQAYVGKLIGKHGVVLQQIRSKAEVNIVIKRHPTSRDEKICAIDGSQEGINLALKLIRQKFPEKKFPHFTLEQITLLRNPDEEIPWISELMHLNLIDGVNNDVIVCHILKPSRIFVQLPAHPTFPSLRILDQNMTQHYNTTDSPAVPDQLSKGMLVVTKWYDRWVRAYVEDPDPTGQQNLVRLVDHGGFWTFSNAEMRKIRCDYLSLPFQAIEVFLANVKPIDGEWKQEAYDVVAQICSGSIGQAQIEGYIDSSIYVSLYIDLQKHGVISLADELVARGFAEAVTLENTVPEDQIPLA